MQAAKAAKEIEKALCKGLKGSFCSVPQGQQEEVFGEARAWECICLSLSAFSQRAYKEFSEKNSQPKGG